MASIEVSTEGSVTDHKLLKQGDAVRVAIGEPNHQSNVWRFWAGRGPKADVYAAIRTVAKEWKFSLHESGVWRYAQHGDFTGVAGPTPLLDSDDRLIARWKRPETDREWVHGLTVRFPHGYLNHAPYPSSLAGVKWLPEPEPSHCVTVSLAISYGRVAPFAAGGNFQFLGGLALGDGGAAAVIAYTEPMPKGEVEVLQGYVTDAPANMKASGWSHDPNGPVSALLWMKDEPTIQLWDLCVGLVPPHDA